MVFLKNCNFRTGIFSALRSIILIIFELINYIMWTLSYLLYTSIPYVFKCLRNLVIVSWCYYFTNFIKYIMFNIASYICFTLCLATTSRNIKCAISTCSNPTWKTPTCLRVLVLDRTIVEEYCNSDRMHWLMPQQRRACSCGVLL